MYDFIVVASIGVIGAFNTRSEIRCVHHSACDKEALEKRENFTGADRVMRLVRAFFIVFNLYALNAIKNQRINTCCAFSATFLPQ